MTTHSFLVNPMDNYVHVDTTKGIKSVVFYEDMCWEINDVITHSHNRTSCSKERLWVESEDLGPHNIKEDIIAMTSNLILTTDGLIYLVWDVDKPPLDTGLVILDVLQVIDDVTFSLNMVWKYGGTFVTHTNMGPKEICIINTDILEIKDCDIGNIYQPEKVQIEDNWADYRGLGYGLDDGEEFIMKRHVKKAK